jgi:hypothetical protein
VGGNSYFRAKVCWVHMIEGELLFRISVIFCPHPQRNDTRSFLKGKTVGKGQHKQKFRTDIIKILDDPKDSENCVFEGYGENHN